jgi:hypothetical protein
MEKKIEDYLHLYLGCQVKIYNLHSVGKFHCIDKLGKIIVDFDDYSKSCLMHEVKPILRPLSDMTEEERSEIFKMVFGREFPSNGGIRFIEKTRIDPSRWVLSSGVDRLGIELDGTVWYDVDLHIHRFNQHERPSICSASLTLD